MNEKILELIEILGLEPDKEGYYHTGWGRKTKEGLIETVKNVLGGKNYSEITLGELLSSPDETIKRNAISILKQLQKK